MPGPKYVLKNPPVAKDPITPIPSIAGAIPQAGGMGAGMPPMAAPTVPAPTVKGKKKGKKKPPPQGGMRVS